MNQLRRMDVLESFQELVQYVPLVHFLEEPFVCDIEHIALHVFEDQVDILLIFRFDYLLELDDVRVLQLLENDNLSVGTL